MTYVPSSVVLYCLRMASFNPSASQPHVRHRSGHRYYVKYSVQLSRQLYRRGYSWHIHMAAAAAAVQLYRWSPLTPPVTIPIYHGTYSNQTRHLRDEGRTTYILATHRTTNRTRHGVAVGEIENQAVQYYSRSVALWPIRHLQTVSARTLHTCEMDTLHASCLLDVAPARTPWLCAFDAGRQQARAVAS